MDTVWALIIAFAAGSSGEIQMPTIEWGGKTLQECEARALITLHATAAVKAYCVEVPKPNIAPPSR